MMDAVHTKLLDLFDIVLGLFFAGNPPKSAAGNGDLVSSYTQMRQLCCAWVAAAECISYWLTGPAVFKVRLCRMVAVRETLLPVWRVGLRFKCRPKGNELLCKQNSCQRDIDVLVYLLSRQLLGSEERSSKASILVDNCPHRLPPQSPFNPFSPENGHIQITGKVLVALMDDHEPISRVPPENTRWCFISRGDRASSVVPDKENLSVQMKADNCVGCLSSRLEDRSADAFRTQIRLSRACADTARRFHPQDCNYAGGHGRTKWRWKFRFGGVLLEWHWRYWMWQLIDILAADAFSLVLLFAPIPPSVGCPSCGCFVSQDVWFETAGEFRKRMRILILVEMKESA